eukprot:1180955-Prorocentrum_minimum.AAC.3
MWGWVSGVLRAPSPLLPQEDPRTTKYYRVCRCDTLTPRTSDWLARATCWYLKGLTENSQLRPFVSVRNYLGGELNSPVAEWLKKVFMSAPSKPSANNWGEN